MYVFSSQPMLYRRFVVKRKCKNLLFMQYLVVDHLSYLCYVEMRSLMLYVNF